MRNLEKQYKFLKTSFSVNDLPPNMSVNDYKEQLKELEDRIKEKHGKDYLELFKVDLTKK